MFGLKLKSNWSRVLLGRKAAQPCREAFLLSACDLVADEQREELGISHFLVDGLLVAGFERVEDTG
jgi:hypothetical protein